MKNKSITGRIKTDKPELHNIPPKYDYGGKAIRDALTPRGLFIDTDFTSLEISFAIELKSWGERRNK